MFHSEWGVEDVDTSSLSDLEVELTPGVLGSGVEWSGSTLRARPSGPR